MWEDVTPVCPQGPPAEDDETLEGPELWTPSLLSKNDKVAASPQQSSTQTRTKRVCVARTLEGACSFLHSATTDGQREMRGGR